MGYPISEHLWDFDIQKRPFYQVVSLRLQLGFDRH